MEYLELTVKAFIVFFILTLPFTLVPLIIFGAAVITILLSNEAVMTVLSILFFIGFFLVILGLDGEEEARRNGY